MTFQSCSRFLVYSIKSVFGHEKSSAALKIGSGSNGPTVVCAPMKWEHLEVENFKLHSRPFLSLNTTPTFTSLCKAPNKGQIVSLFQTTATIITRGASLILIGFLTATLLLFAIANIWDASRILHFNMEISLLLAHICLLPPNLYEYSEEMCRFVSILIHFFHLACFSFMFLESLHLYSLVGWVVKR